MLAGDKPIGKHGVEILGDEEIDDPILKRQSREGARTREGRLPQEGGQL